MKIQRVIITDDMTGSELGEGEGETVAFAVDGVAYTIDLNPANAVAFRAALAPYVAKAAKVSARGRTTTVSRPTARPDAGVVRAWAIKNGVTVAAKGRIKAETYAAYAARDSAATPAPVDSPTPLPTPEPAIEQVPAKAPRKAAPRKAPAKTAVKAVAQKGKGSDREGEASPPTSGGKASPSRATRKRAAVSREGSRGD